MSEGVQRPRAQKRASVVQIHVGVRIGRVAFDVVIVHNVEAILSELSTVENTVIHCII